MINLHQLDQIADQDQAIAALEGFVSELVAEFVTTAEGKAYLQAYPEMTEYVGSWIDHLLYFGYAYESVTLPQMTMSNVEAVVTRIFPQKISLLDPAEAETIIPELKAFWQFLKREYQHPQAHKIIKFLKQLQPKFTEIMNDPQNFGIAKIWLTSGMAAGFDMTTEAGIKEFQQQSDRYST
ncbi:MAG: plasmid pRiA4b ORF-3 family protein, partial [Cyanobacteria bacterium J06553_1]